MSFRKRVTVNVFCFFVLAAWAVVADDPYENEYGDEYGVEWLYFVTDNATRIVMNFSSLPADTRGLLFGEAYFTLYTRQNRDNPEPLIIPEGDANINSTYFNASNDIKVITHGWISSESTTWLQNIRDEYLVKYDYNVITVDWSEIARNPSYVWPALSTRYVGKRVAKLLDSLEKSYQGQRKLHLIGHSLGAQVMGYAGMFSGRRIDRITGLDPARPLFEFPEMPANFRLEKSDAEFVDIIHSCAGVYGYRNSHGHADFYPNSGRPRQPGCEGPQYMIEGCSHGRSCEFYNESISSDVPFIAYPCDSWKSFQNGNCKTDSTKMGDPVCLNSRGDYYLHTHNTYKYAMGDEFE
ncbi:lipase member H [Pectinophora gossypiella]|uniref:lipase member H n=1 Tax=Pectinophora gossypiella TaxID=13191 RepID=UPI00214E2B01|nr:lipase member H [Pectinophora gossypiella]